MRAVGVGYRSPGVCRKELAGWVAEGLRDTQVPTFFALLRRELFVINEAILCALLRITAVTACCHTVRVGVLETAVSSQPACVSYVR